MATTTGASATGDSDRPPPLPLDSIPIIDLSLLSQSELFSLSMCSNSSFDLNRCDDVVIPKIDRSVFNESAGSRKQTYSRLRLAPAQSTTSNQTTIHRRTPRLRSSHSPTPNSINDAEQAENSQIIRMLKELFISDNNFQELVPIEVEIHTTTVVPQLLTPETNRKRGRPRKHENAVFIHPPPAKRICNNTAKQVVAYVAERDTETVNSRGVKVNLKKLGKLEDPYGLEIRRRTEGMSTKDELLGFLGALNGEWGTSRKKTKVVDASNFGDALPTGWKLSLSIKKKLDRVWLICRRYISPSGRPFESCKEVSTYLLSLVKEENLNKPQTHTQSNNDDDFASKLASVKVGISVREDTRRNKPIVLALSSSKHQDLKKQVKSNIVGPIDVQLEELDHKVLAHKTETSLQLASEVSELTLVKYGIFECQFCNKTFNERNQYNEHIGTHDTIDKKTCEESESPNTEKTAVMETEYSEIEKESNVSVSKSDFCLDNEVSMSINETNRNLENSVVTVDCVNEDKCNKVLFGYSDTVEKDTGGISNGQDSVSETEVTHVDDNNPECILENGKSSEIRVHEIINDTDICSSFDDLTSEKVKVINEDHVSEVNKPSDSETLPLNSHNANLIFSQKQVSSQKLGFEVPVDHVIHEFEENGITNSGVVNSGVDEQHEFKSNETEEKECLNEVIVSKIEESQTQMNMDDFDLENNVKSVSSNRSTEVNLDDFQVFRNDESIKNEVQNDLSDIEFTFQDDVTGIYENAPESSEMGLLDPFSITETSEDIFGNKIYSAPLDAFKFDEEREIGINELSLNFENSHSNGLYENTVNLDPKKDDVEIQQSGFSLNGFRQVRSEEGSSGVFPYNTGGLDESFGSGFWSGKNGMVGRNVIMGVCAWCRNEFHMEHEIQGGVGSLCPTCSGQVNML